jgi:hypothetical protein
MDRVIAPALMTLIDAIAEAGTCLRIAACTPLDRRGAELDRLERATVAARKLADAYGYDKLHDRTKIELRMCEMGLAKMSEECKRGRVS